MTSSPAGTTVPMRIGTWNLAGRWSGAHLRLIEAEPCDVWLLTEIAATTQIPGGDMAVSAAMGDTTAWAAVWGRDGVEAETSPHEAAAFARHGGTRFCSCILPWRGAGPHWPDAGAGAAMTHAALARLRPSLVAAGDGVWGGDGNHAMEGPGHAGSTAGTAAIRQLVAAAGLVVATHASPHVIEGVVEHRPHRGARRVDAHLLPPYPRDCRGPPSQRSRRLRRRDRPRVNGIHVVASELEWAPR